MLLLLVPSSSPAQSPANTDASAREAWAATCEDWDEWDKPGPPFRIHGDTYYVGTCGIGAIFIEYSEGFVLIDTGTDAGAGVVIDNIRTLGLDVSAAGGAGAILQSHEHFDHVGGLARLARALSATPIVNEDVIAVYTTGQPDPRDPQAGMHEPMAPAINVSSIQPGETIEYDGLHIRSIATPGHTPGALSWQWESCDEAGDCRTIVYADSMSPISNDSYRFSDHPEYLAAFRDGIAHVAALDCDILLTPHPSASGMRDKLLSGDLASGTNCRDYAASITERLDARLAEEAANQ